ncbi:MAG: hypothetical protein QM640_13730 [Niabella sp.]
MQLFIIALIIPWLILLSKTKIYPVFRVVFAILAGIAALGWIGERVSGKTNKIAATAAYLNVYGLWIIAGLALFSVIAFLFQKFKQR